MASIGNVTYKQITQTTAQFTAYVSDIDNSSTKTYYQSASLSSPSGASLSAGKSGSHSSGYTINCTVSGLKPGQQVTIVIIFHFNREKYVPKTVFRYLYKLKTSSNWRTSGAYSTRREAVDAMNSLDPEVYDTGGTFTEDASYWTDDGSTTESASVTVYTRPNNFYFGKNGSVASGTQWEVSKGIQTILPNIYSFNTELGKWKNWREQSGGHSYSVFASGSKLSASMLSNAYSILGGSSAYKTGDKVSAVMFSGIENLFNR